MTLTLNLHDLLSIYIKSKVKPNKKKLKVTKFRLLIIKKYYNNIFQSLKNYCLLNYHFSTK